MAVEKPEPSGFLALIDAKIAALQQLRESLITAISVGALGQFGDVEAAAISASQSGSGVAQPGEAAKGPIELPTGVFRGKGLADAIRQYLTIARRKRTQKEIESALIEGGLATTAERFDATLSATLHRMKKNGELLQFKDGWDLAESYPDSFKQRMAQTAEAPKRGKKKAAAKKKAAKATPKAKAPVPPAVSEPHLKAV
jgi:hypothetical protein